jgi:hypothetical protein
MFWSLFPTSALKRLITFGVTGRMKLRRGLGPTARNGYNATLVLSVINWSARNKPLMNIKLIPGNTVITEMGCASQRIILRSINFVTRETIWEKESSWRHTKGEALNKYSVTPKFFTIPITNDIDVEYAQEILEKQLEYAKARSTGKHKVSKACIKRFESQLSSIQS